ncbi:MAG: hypothetical protein P1V18_05310 [Candidatus Gracilibacteria bacterium]|nr:hypothetical protein [Candidatus Gracilibacteria bacterium]
MSQDQEKFRLPLKKFPVMLDVKIRVRVIKLKVARWFVEVNQVLSVKKLVASGLTLSVVAACGTMGARFHAYNGAVVPGDFLYEMRRDLEVAYLEDTTTSAERVEQLFGLSQRRLEEAELLLDGTSVAFDFIPEAFAQDTEEVDSEVSELIIEASNYEALALEEISVIEDLDILEDLSAKADSFHLYRDTVLESLNVKISKDDERRTFKRVSDAVQQHRQLFGDLRDDLKEAREQSLDGVPFDPRPIEIPFKRKKMEGHRKHFERVRSEMDIRRVKKFAEKNISHEEIEVLEKHIDQLIEEGRGEEVRKHIKDFKKQWKHEERLEKFREKKRGHFKMKLENMSDLIPPSRREEFVERIDRGDDVEVREELREIRKEQVRKDNPPPKDAVELVDWFVKRLDDGELPLDEVPRIREIIKIAPKEDRAKIQKKLSESLGFDPAVLEPPPPVRPRR